MNFKLISSQNRSQIENPVLQWKNFTVHIKRRKGSRRLSLRINREGKILLSVPVRCSRSQILLFLEEYTPWLQKHHAQILADIEKNPPPQLKSGGVFPYLGKNHQLILRYGESLGLELRDNTMWFSVPVDQNDFEDFRHQYWMALQKAYAQTALTLMRQRLQFYEDQMGLKARSLKLGWQKSLWGSCSSRHDIVLNVRLIVAPLSVIDYVVVHELAHITYRHHGPQFWHLVAQHCSHYQQAKLWLRQNVRRGDFLVPVEF